MAQAFGKHQWGGSGGRRNQGPMYGSYSQNAPVSYPISGSPYSNASGGMKVRTFSGHVSKLTENYGFVDEDVYFHRSCCVSEYPSMGARVVVEATFNPSGQYKWTATRLELEKPSYYVHDGGKRGRNSGGRDYMDDRKRRKMDKSRERFRDVRKDREHEKTFSPSRRQRSRSPQRRKPVRYNVKVPNDLLTLPEYDISTLKRRFGRLYVPSDFFLTSSSWTEVFPVEKPFSIEQPCSFHIMHKECDSLYENKANYDPEDSDYLYTSKVVLMSISDLEDIYRKCITLTEDDEKNPDRISHITRAISFLVGMRKNEPMAIGGPWSPSLDGANPDKDSSVLINTAVRNCKALTGIDLSSCTQWYRFLEVYYHRSESVYRGKSIPARVETVVYFIPEVWTCAPTHLEWDGIVLNYSKVLERKINPSSKDTKETNVVEDAKTTPIQNHTQTPQKDDLDNTEKDEEMIVIDKCEPTHYAKLDPKVMKVNDLRQELEARNLSPRGLKSQLMSRLAKALKSEENKEEEQQKEEAEKSVDASEEATEEKPDESKDDVETKEELKDDATKEKEDDEEEEEEKVMSESERGAWMKRYTLPSTPHIIVHPSQTAKGGQFDCSITSLSSLLDYRTETNKEYVFEMHLFAELFNDMLNRDFGYKILQALYNAPEKPKEEKEKTVKDEKKPDVEDKKTDEAAVKLNNGEDKHDVEDTEMKVISEIQEDTESVEKDESSKTETEGMENGQKENGDDKAANEEKEKMEKEKAEKERLEKEKEELKKKAAPVKYYTKDRDLLLSFLFFDRSNGGYIYDRDLESIFYSMGLYLSRNQIKKMISKVSVRDTVHYRKLTDKPKVENVEGELESIAEEKEPTLNPIISNKKLIPNLFEEDATTDSHKPRTSRRSKGDSISKTSTGLVHYNGSLVDIDKILQSIKRSETARISMEKKIHHLTQESDSLKEVAKQNTEKAKVTSSDLQTCRGKLITSNREIISLKAKLKSIVKVLTTVKNHIDPLIENCNEKLNPVEKSAKDKKEEVPKKKEHNETVKQEPHDIKDVKPVVDSQEDKEVCSTEVTEKMETECDAE